MSPGWERDGSGMGAGCSERIRGPHRSGPSSIPRGTASPTRDGGRLTARVGLRDTVGVLGDRSRCKKPRGHRSSGGHGSAKGHPGVRRCAPIAPSGPSTPSTPNSHRAPRATSIPSTPSTAGAANPFDISLFLHHPIARHGAKSSSSQRRPPPSSSSPGTKCVRSPGPGATSARRTTRSDSRMGPSSCVPSRH